MPFVATNQQIQDQIDQLFSTTLLDQRKIGNIKKADSDKQSFSQNILNESIAFSPSNCNLTKSLLTEKGHGPFIELTDGSIKYNLSQMFGSNLLGQSHPIYVKTQVESALGAIIEYDQFISDHEQLMTQQLLPHLGSDKISRFHFLESKELVEDILQLSLQGQIIAINKRFLNPVHAQNSLYLSSVNLQEDIIVKLERAWSKNPNSFKIICVEMLDEDSGYICRSSSFYRQIFDWAKSKQLIIWVDESQSFGRTHELFCQKMLNLQNYADLITLGNVLETHSILSTENLYEKIKAKFATRTNGLASIKLATKIARYLSNANFYGENGRVREIEVQILSDVKNAIKHNSSVKEINVIGTFLTLTTDNPKQDFERLFENGIIGQLISQQSKLGFLLPLCLNQDHIQEICSILARSIK